MKDLSQLKKLNDFVDNAALIRDISKVKQVTIVGTFTQVLH